MALRRRRPTRAFAVAVVIGLTLVACTDDDDDAAGTTTTEESTTTSESTTTTERTTTTLSGEAKLLADYEAATVAFSAAGNPPNPDHPELLARWMGAALAFVQSTINQYRSAGVGTENSIEHHPIGVSISGSAASIEDCYVDRTQLINLETGLPHGEPGMTNVHADVRLELANGTWKIAELNRREEPCTPG